MVDDARDLFRNCGCLEYVSELVLSAQTSEEVQQSALYTLGCAVEGNCELVHTSPLYCTRTVVR